MFTFLHKTRALIMRRKAQSALLGGLLLGVIFGVMVFGEDETTAPVPESFPVVQVATVAELSNGSALLPLIGTLESQSEATIQTERSGQVTAVNYGLGDRVAPGAVIASIENRSEVAAIASARAGVQAAQANLTGLESELARSSGTTASDALNAWKSAYGVADNAVNNQTDVFFENDRGQFPHFLLSTNNDDRLEASRAQVADALETWQRDLNDVTVTDNLLPHLTQARESLSLIQTFLNDLAQAVNRTPTSAGGSVVATEGDRAALAAARSSIDGVLASTIGMEDNVRESLAISGGTALSGENATRIAAATAGLNQARAALASASASYEKTLIRAPIAGVISMIELDYGNYVGMGVPVVTITNAGSLEVVTFITENDTEFVTPGAEVTVDEKYQGRVTRVSPGLNLANKKIEVRIGLLGDVTGLSAGQTVSVKLSTELETPSLGADIPLSIPLTALKLTTEGAQVFTVNENVLVAHDVMVDRVLGESVLIAEGLTADMQIVIDARGHKAGEKVTAEREQARR